MNPTLQAALDTLHRHTVQRLKDCIRVGGIVAARSPKWPAFRRNFLAIHTACEACGGVLDLEVHHVKSFHEHPELELDPTNLITLCQVTHGKECHLNFGHRFGMMTRGDWKVNNPKVREDARSFRNRQFRSP